MMTKEERIETRRVAGMLAASLQKAITPPMSTLTELEQRMMMSAPATVIQLLDALDEMERIRFQLLSPSDIRQDADAVDCGGHIVGCIRLAAWGNRCLRHERERAVEMERERDAIRENSHRGWEVRDASYVALEHAHDDLKASRDYWLDQSEALKRERAVLANERDEWKARAERAEAK